MQSKHGCAKCARVSTTKLQKMSIEKVKNAFIKRGYEPLFDDYEKAKNKLKCKCNIHGIFEISYDNLKQGKGCVECSREK